MAPHFTELKNPEPFLAREARTHWHLYCSDPAPNAPWLTHSAPATQTSLLFLTHARLTPTSGPLYLLIPPPQLLSLQVTL